MDSGRSRQSITAGEGSNAGHKVFPIAKRTI